MCVGGGPEPIKIKGKGFAKQFRKKAKILKPSGKELKALDRQIAQQMGFIASMQSPNSSLNRAQSALDAAQKNLQLRLTGIENIAIRMADSKAAIQKQALTLAALKGPPPPEKSAAPPRLGGQDDPVDWRQTGRHALTITEDSSGLAIE
jgi:hypothetical protein